MSDIICSSCVIKTTEKREERAVFKDGAEVDFSNFLLQARKLGVHPLEAKTSLLTGKKHPGLPGYVFKKVMRELETEHGKRFDGTLEQAEAAGWQENEFGIVCPTCAGTEEEDPEVEHGTGWGKMEDALTALQRTAEDQASDQEEAAKYITPNCFCGDGTVDVRTIIKNLSEAPYESQYGAGEAVMKVLEGVAADSTDPEVATSLRESIGAIYEWMDDSVGGLSW